MFSCPFSAALCEAPHRVVERGAPVLGGRAGVRPRVQQRPGDILESTGFRERLFVRFTDNLTVRLTTLRVRSGVHAGPV